MCRQSTIRACTGSRQLHITSKNVAARYFSEQHTSPSRGVDFSAVKLGVGLVVATAVPGSERAPFITQLSTVSHKSPVRLIPTTTSVASCAKQISVGHYGGGMAEGDTATVNIQVQKHARLHVRTQGINRVYGHGNQHPYHIRGMKQSDEKIPTKISTNCVDAFVDEHGLLVYAPDPVSLHSGAQYRQCTDYVLKDLVTSNLVAIDWICSGRRYSKDGEYWNHKNCTTRTTVRFQSEKQEEQNIPALIDAQCITVEGISTFATTNRFHALTTVILSGSMVVENDETTFDSVVQRFLCLQSALMTPHTAVRKASHDSENSAMATEVHSLLNEQLSVGGRVVVGVTKTNTSTNTKTPSLAVPIYTVRIVATSNEDIYRILHYCLLPLAPYLDGIECYKDRTVHASRSPPVTMEHLHPPQSYTPRSTTSEESRMTENSTLRQDVHSSRSNYWTAYMLADSALPIGSFAHSSGIEVASQLGLLSWAGRPSCHNDSVATYVRAAVTSTMQLSTPLLWCSHSLTTSLMHQLTALKDVVDGPESQHVCDTFHKEYKILDSYAQASLATNGPSCRASLDQGRNLLRVAQSAFVTSSSIDEKIHRKILKILERAIESSELGGHMTTIFGVVTQLLQLNVHDAVRLHGFCVARDLINAAVRLNLIGPMEGQTILLLHANQAAVNGINRAEAAIRASMLGQRTRFDEEIDHAMLQSVLSTSMGSAPILDTLHPCHDVLATRLFRT